MTNKDDPTERLMAENAQANKMINEARIILTQYGDICGMSFLASIKEIVKKYNNLVSENTNLKEEVKNLQKKVAQTKKS